MTLALESPSYGGDIYALAEDADYVYAAGLTTQTVRKYLKATMAFVGESPGYGGNIWVMIEDGIYIYTGGVTTQTIRKYIYKLLSGV